LLSRELMIDTSLEWSNRHRIRYLTKRRFSRVIIKCDRFNSSPSMNISIISNKSATRKMNRKLESFFIELTIGRASDANIIIRWYWRARVGSDGYIEIWYYNPSTHHGERRVFGDWSFLCKMICQFCDACHLFRIEQFIRSGDCQYLSSRYHDTSWKYYTISILIVSDSIANDFEWRRQNLCVTTRL